MFPGEDRERVASADCCWPEAVTSGFFVATNIGDAATSTSPAEVSGFDSALFNSGSEEDTNRCEAY
jgi:hypothetical protein